MIDIHKLKEMNQIPRYAVTIHAKQRLLERGIKIDDIVNCVADGEIIKQYEDDKPLPSCLILGKNLAGQSIHAVVSHDEDYIYLISLPS